MRTSTPCRTGIQLLRPGQSGEPEQVPDGGRPPGLPRPAVPDQHPGRVARLRQPPARLDAGAGRPGELVDGRVPLGAEPVQRLPHHPRLLDGGQPREDRRRPHHLRPVHDARQAARVRARAVQRQRRQPGELRLPGRRHVRPRHPGRGRRAWRAATGCATTLCGFDNVFYVTAGHDESSTWQEFGEMLWADREQVPAEFGPPGAENGPVLNAAGNPIPNWSPTRYVPWSSWLAAANHWPNAGGGILDAGRELRAERLRPRVQPPAEPAGQLQQPVRRQRAELHRLLGDDEPRHVQRPRRHAQPVADPEPGRFGARAAPHARVQEPPRRAHGR